MKKLSFRFVFIVVFTLVALKVMTTLRLPETDEKTMLLTQKEVPPVKNPQEIIAEASEAITGNQHQGQNQFESSIKALPTIDDLQSLTNEEVHHTPEIIKDGGELIGKIHDEADQDPSKRVDAMIFFKTCAEDAQIATPIRAVCLNKIYKLVPVWKIPVPLTESISDEVSELALRL